MDNQEKGRIYEHFVKDTIINELHKNAYLWNQCPENLLIKYRLIKSRNAARLIRKAMRATGRSGKRKRLQATC